VHLKEKRARIILKAWSAIRSYDLSDVLEVINN
jgi:hypothetical protein